MGGLVRIVLVVALVSVYSRYAVVTGASDGIGKEYAKQARLHYIV